MKKYLFFLLLLSKCLYADSTSVDELIQMTNPSTTTRFYVVIDSASTVTDRQWHWDDIVNVMRDSITAGDYEIDFIQDHLSIYSDDGTNWPYIKIHRNHADNTSGLLWFLKTSSSPADGDEIAYMKGTGYDDIGNTTTFWKKIVESSDVSNGQESAEIIESLIMNGTSREFFHATGYDGTVGHGEIVWNDDGQDVNWRIETDTNDSTFVIDGSTGKIYSSTDTIHIYSTNWGTSTPLLLLEQDHDSYNGAGIEFYKNTESPSSTAPYDDIGKIVWSSKDDAGNKEIYGQIETYLKDPANGDEAAYMMFDVSCGDNLYSFLKLDGKIGSVADVGEVAINDHSLKIHTRIETDTNDSTFVIDGVTGKIILDTDSLMKGDVRWNYTSSDSIDGGVIKNGTITGGMSQESIEDIAGGMWTGNTETLITISYQDGDGTIDAVVNNDLHSYSWTNVVDSDIPDAITATNYLLLTAIGDSLINYDGSGIKITDLDAINVLVDYNGGIEIADDSLNIKLDGSTLTLSSAGLKITDTYDDGFQLKIDFGDSLVNYDGDGLVVKNNDAINVLLDYNGGLETVDDSINIKINGSELATTSSGLAIASTITRDVEWDTEGEVQTVWGSVNILLETEIDASSELAAIMDDETGTAGNLVFSNSPVFDDDITLGKDGADGQLRLYSEQGGTDYFVWICPNNAMTDNILLYLPSDLPESTYLLNMTNGGIIGYDANAYLTSTSFAKDLVTSSPLSGGADNVLYGTDSDVTLSIAVLKDLVAGTGLSGGADDVLTGADADVTISHSTANGYVHIPADGASAQILQYSSAGTAKWITVSSDASIADNGAVTVANDSHDHTGSTISGIDISDDTNLSGGDGLSMSGDAVKVNLDYDGGIETVDDSINVKLNGSTLNLSASGLKVTDNTYQPLEATLTDIADGTIAEDLVNTAYPWANNEVADNITATNYLLLTAADDTIQANVTRNIAGAWNFTNAQIDFSGDIVLADDKSIGLGSGKALLGFDDQSTDYAYFSNCLVSIGMTSPTHSLAIGGTTPSVQVGDAFNYSPSKADFVVGSSNSDSRFLFGQDNTYFGGMIWKYNATAANAYMKMIMGNTDVMTFLQSGNVGIGTLAPITITEIQGGLTTVGSVLTLSSKETSTVLNDILGRINFRAALDAAGTDAILTGASIAAIAENTFSASVNETGLQFSTGASEAAVERMRIDHHGNVGIGTTAPLFKLEVNGSSFFGGLLSIVSAGDGVYGNGMRVLANDYLTSGGVIEINKQTGSSTYGSIQVGDVGDYRALVLNPMGGNVGIRTTAPAKKLHIIGDIAIGDSATATNVRYQYWAKDASCLTEYNSYTESTDTWEWTGDLKGVNIEGTTYGSDKSVSNAELLYVNTLSSNAQDQLDARCLESVFGTAIGTGLTLDGTTLKTHASLQSIAGLTETNGGLLYGTADNTYAWLAAGTAGYVLQANGAAAPTWLNIAGTYQGLDADLTALAALSTTGMMARTAANTYTMRTLTGTASEIEITNGDGISGNPTIGLPDNVTITDDLTADSIFATYFGGKSDFYLGKSGEDAIFKSDSIKFLNSQSELASIIHTADSLIISSTNPIRIGGYTFNPTGSTLWEANSDIEIKADDDIRLYAEQNESNASSIDFFIRSAPVFKIDTDKRVHIGDLNAADTGYVACVDILGGVRLISELANPTYPLTLHNVDGGAVGMGFYSGAGVLGFSNMCGWIRTFGLTTGDSYSGLSFYGKDGYGVGALALTIFGATGQAQSNQGICVGDTTTAEDDRRMWFATDGQFGDECIMYTQSTDLFTLSGDLKIWGNDVDLGDAGGFSGFKFDPGTTTLDVYIDGTKIGHFSTNGSYTDDVP